MSIFRDAQRLHDELKQAHPEEVVLVRAGVNYISFGSDAYLVPAHLHTGVGLAPVTGYPFVVVTAVDVEHYLPPDGFFVWDG